MRKIQMHDLEYREDLPFLLNEMGLVGKGVEVGVLRGAFSQHLLRYWNGQTLYGVDAWRHLSGVVDINNPDHNGHLNNLAEAFKALYGFQERSVLIRDLSERAAELFPLGTLDFVYIDAAHAYEHIRKDIAVWAPRVRKGGLIAGHDYLDGDLSCGEFGVKRAVDEWAQQHSLRVWTTTKDQFPSWMMVQA
jgi:hypothetical protein